MVSHAGDKAQDVGAGCVYLRMFYRFILRNNHFKRVAALQLSILFPAVNKCIYIYLKNIIIKPVSFM